MNDKLDNFDVVVIGAGPGGYVCALECAKLGFKVACIDDFKRDGSYSLGGTCLNVGCVPSKALLQSSENFIHAQHELKEHGINCEKVSFDFKKMMERKKSIVDKNAGGINFLFKNAKVAELHGKATISSFDEKEDNYLINIAGESKFTVKAKHVVIASGSNSREINNFKIDNIDILDNVGALELKEVPKSIVMIGCGVIGVEISSIYKRLGANVTILEYSDVFFPALDLQIAKELQTQLVNQGLDIKLGAKVVGYEKVSSSGMKSKPQDRYKVKYNYNNKEEMIECDKVIVAVGRSPNSLGIADAKLNLSLDAKGFINVDDKLRTNLKNVYAIGDCTNKAMLAHRASIEGTMVANIINNKYYEIDYNALPFVIYTSPEVAYVGKNEKELTEMGVEFKKSVSRFSVNARAMAYGNPVGFIKVLSDKKTQRILGVHMIGPFVSELINQASTLMGFKANLVDASMMIVAHPSISEVLHDACHA